MNNPGSLVRKKNRHLESVISESDLYRMIEMEKARTDLILEEMRASQISNVETTPRKIKAYLDQYVISQEDAKIDTAIAVYDHLRRNALIKEDPNLAHRLKKNNILIIGPTGCGKTFIAENVARFLDVPVLIVNTKEITAPGYVGRNLEDPFMDMITLSRGNIEQAQHGIIVLDEVDKIAKKGHGGYAVNDEDVQTIFLKPLEGTIIPIKTKKGTLEFNTAYTLFFGAGAFSNLTLPGTKPTGERTLGFGSSETGQQKKVKGRVTRDDLVSYGFLPEFINRFTTIASVESLSSDELVSILLNPNTSPLEQLRMELAFDGIELEISKDTYRIIAEASPKSSGARGLENICKRIARDLKFNAPEWDIDKFLLDRRYVEEHIND